MAFTKVATVSELVPGKGIMVQVAGKPIGLFYLDGTCYAIDNLCPHRQAPLHEGPCEGTQVACPWHNAKFELTTGAHCSPPAKTGVKTYPVKIVDQEVQIDVV